VTLHVFRKKLRIKEAASVRTARKKKKDRFQRETSLEVIKSYLKNNEILKNPLVFFYREDTSPRVISDYYLDEKYINVKSTEGYYIKFLIDKIRKI
jgi:hypothetical protein